MATDTAQTLLNLHMDDDGTVKIRIKPFIQPFEKKLAELEIRSILAIPKTKKIKIDANGFITLKISPQKINELRSKLAYTDLIGVSDLQTTLQTNLESTYVNGSTAALPRRRVLRYGPHGMHEYRGKFFPQMVRALINTCALPLGSTVLDPMCGSGTTSVVAKEMGFKAVGVDMNPLSVELTKAKTEILDFGIDQLEQIQSRILDAIYAPQAKNKGRTFDSDVVSGWFSPAAIDEIGKILRTIDAQDKKYQRFLKICLSNILRQVSYQKTADLRIRKEIYDYLPGTTFDLFAAMLKKNVANAAAYLGALHAHNGPALLEATTITGDARSLNETLSAIAGKVDVIITSPPYATALPYLDTDRLSLAILGLLTSNSHKELDIQMIGNREINKAIKEELWGNYLANKDHLTPQINALIDRIESNNNADELAGFRKKNLAALLAKYFFDMRQVLQKSLLLCRDDANAFFVVGNNSTTVRGEKVTIHTDQLLWDLAGKVGWKQVEYIPMELLPSRDIFRENRGSTETILWLKK